MMMTLTGPRTSPSFPKRSATFQKPCALCNALRIVRHPLMLMQDQQLVYLDSGGAGSTCSTKFRHPASPQHILSNQTVSAKHIESEARLSSSDDPVILGIGTFNIQRCWIFALWRRLY